MLLAIIIIFKTIFPNGERMNNKNGKERTRIENMEIFHQDGIIEIVAGAVLLNVGFDILNKVTFTSLFTYIPILLMSSMKKQITITRIGYDAFDGDEMKVRNWNLFIAIGMVIILMALSVFVLSDMLNLQASIALPYGHHLPSLLEGLILAIGCLAAALFIPLKRFYFYAAIALVIGVIGFFFFPAQVPAFVFAFVLLGNGARLMILFSRKYPLEKDTERKDSKKGKK